MESQTMSAKLEALEVVVQETKQASQLLMGEQNELAQRSQAVEQRFVEAQADLARSEASKLKYQRNHDAMASKLQDAQQRLAKSNQELDEERSANEIAQRKIEELESTNKSYKGRLERLEEELRKSQELFLDVSTATKEATNAKDQLQDALEKLQQANKELHEQLQQEQQKQRQQHEKHQDALSKLQQKNRETTEQMESFRDEAAAMKLKKVEAEKKAAGLQTRLANLERRMSDSMDLKGIGATTNTSKSSKSGGGVGDPLTTVEEGNETLGGDDPDNGTPKIPSLPALVSAKKSRDGKMVPKCAFCFKDVTGPSRKCQCGKDDCTARAHAQCAQRFVGVGTSTSVSHRTYEYSLNLSALCFVFLSTQMCANMIMLFHLPAIAGTPAPKLPVILCRPLRESGIVVDTDELETNETNCNAITPANRNNRASF
jgi:chemotaxis protein histidine kinase CheA